MVYNPMKLHRGISLLSLVMLFTLDSRETLTAYRGMFSSAQPRISFGLVENASLSSNSIRPGGRLSRRTRMFLLRTEAVLRARDSMHRNDAGAPFTLRDRGIRFGETAKAQS
ncbi:unnamed protein product [Lasius platythorax]|uniref:Secreted protein n=1 Tax=Lasius platythorax TaxID=488582 RepID=A0AAV2NTK9_9HYME